MSRRTFLVDTVRLGGSLAGLSLLAGCTPTPPPAATGRMYRVGLLAPGLAEESTLYTGADVFDMRPHFWGRLAELGYVEGQNLTREERRATGDTFPDLAVGLVQLPVDVIVVTSGPAIAAAMAATASIPIVLLPTAGTNDPVAAGWVESLARPGKNVTGMAGAPPEVDLKRLQLLVEAVPGVTKVGVLGTPPDLSGGLWRSASEALGVALIPLPHPLDGFEAAVHQAVAQGAEALLTRVGLGTAQNMHLIGSLAARYRLPGVAGNRDFVAGGGLMVYEIRRAEVQRRAAEYVDRILRGAHPGDLPVELPSRYDLVFNLRAARDLDLTPSRDFLARADEVIE